jgi:two-component system sporulation sensor kinase A
LQDYHTKRHAQTLTFARLKRYNPDPILALDKEGFFNSANEAALKLLHFTEAELKQLHFTDIVTDDCVEYARECFLKVIKEKILDEAFYTIRTKSGELIDVLVTPAPIIIHDQVVGCYIITRDITEQKKKDELLINSEKQTLAGQLAAAIAHEIRNPLTAIKGFFKLMKTVGYNEKYMNIVEDEFNRIEMITSELLVLAKPQNMKMEDKDMHVIMDQVIALLETQANMNNVVIIRDYCGDSLTLRCDENQIKQVLINIMKNSIEVMPKGGEVEVNIRKDSGKLLIAITDQGPGIAQDLIGKLGEPFYSTKEKGTGLGLMVSFKIIEIHGGKINISSELNRGTTFEVELPAL